MIDTYFLYLFFIKIVTYISCFEKIFNIYIFQPPPSPKPEKPLIQECKKCNIWLERENTLAVLFTIQLERHEKISKLKIKNYRRRNFNEKICQVTN